MIGVGLLGGSLGKAMRERGLTGRVTGYVRRAAGVEECLRAGAVDTATLDLEEAVRGSDLVVLCTPLSQMSSLAARCAPFLKPHCLVTDVGSVKGSVTKELESVLAGSRARFVGSHPMAGSERTGVSAARGDLFEQAVCVVTRTEQTSEAGARRIERLWAGVGARVIRLSPEAHDLLVSRSSHAPHVIAAALANMVLAPAYGPVQSQLCATGFRDTTRIAASSPEMWRDIAIANRKNLRSVLTRFMSELSRFSRALDRKDEAAVRRFFETARARREAWAANGRLQSPE